MNKPPFDSSIIITAWKLLSPSDHPETDGRRIFYRKATALLKADTSLDAEALVNAVIATIEAENEVLQESGNR